MNLATLALRNLARHRRRTLVTAAAIAFGSLAVVVLQGFVNSFVLHLQEESVLTQVGALQVCRRGFLGSSDPLQLSFADAPALRERIRAVPGVAAVAPRLAFDGLLSNGAEATMFVATAIEPLAEDAVCPRRRAKVAAGTRPLGPDDRRGAIVGKALADALGGEPGSTLVLQAAGARGATNALDVTVQGFLPLTVDPNESKRSVIVSLDLAQSLLRLPGRITQYAVRVEDLAQTEEIAAALRAALGEDFEVTTWRQMDPGTAERTQVMAFVLVFIGGILLLLVASAILNTVLISVYERVREIGTMLAVGVRRRQVRALFLWEAAWLGLASALVGVGLGRALLALITAARIEWHPPDGTRMTLHPHVGPGFLAFVVAFAALGTVASALYPAWKASRLRPVEALRAN